MIFSVIKFYKRFNILRIIFFICLLITSFCPNAIAQIGHLQIKGQVSGHDNNPVSFASIVLLAAKDSSIVETAIADEDGRFIIKKLPEGKYIVCIVCLGYNNKYYPAIDMQIGDDFLDNMQLIMDEKIEMIDEIEVTATMKRPPIQINTDKVTINVANSINSTGLSAIEILRKSPGVRIIGEDNIMLNGKTGLLLYLDGNQVNLKGNDLADFLRSMPSSNIETIEIILNPSSKYDAAGNAGIISIKTKKNINLNFNGDISLNSEFNNYKPKYGGAFNLNYGSKMFNVYGNYNYFHNNTRVTMDYFRKQEVQNNLIAYDQKYKNKTDNEGHNYKGGIDFFLSSANTIGIVIEGNTGNGNAFLNSNTYISDVNSHLDSLLLAKNNIRRNNNRNTYTFNYNYSDTLGREFNAIGNYGKFKKSSNSYQPNIYLDSQGNETSKATYYNETATDINITSAMFNYKQPLWKGTFETGIKCSHVETKNDLQYFNQAASITIPDTSRTNQFLYKENIVAAYSNYTFTLQSWSFQLGVRSEYTSSKGKLESLTNVNKQSADTSYFSLFPNVMITYAINNKHSLYLTYNKRIDRPAYESLNPFEFVMDELSYVKGNPFLKPQLTKSIKLSYGYQQQYLASFSYANTNDFILNYRDTLSGGKTFETPTNVTSMHIFAIDLSARINVTNWWELYGGINGLHQKIRGVGRIKSTNLYHNTWSFYANNSFNLPYKWRGEISGYYNAAFMDVPAIVSPQWSIDVGIQKRLLKDALVVKLSISDLFNTLEYRLKRDFGGLYYQNHSKWVSQQLRLTFSYKFGNIKLKGPKNRENGLKDLRNRIK